MNSIHLQQISVGVSDLLITLISFGVALDFKRLSFVNRFSILWFKYFFWVSLASLFGGIYHLFSPGILKPPMSSFLWYVTLFLLGLVSIMGWRLICLMGWGITFKKRQAIIEMNFLIIYSFIVFKYPYFIVGSIFLGCVAIGHALLGLIKSIQSFSLTWFLYMLGWMCYLSGALIQFFNISWNTISLSNNTLYHLMSAIAIIMIYISIKKLIIEDKF